MNECPNQTALTNNFEFDALHQANKYREALVRDFSPFLHGRVIEVGCGIGQVTELLLQNAKIEYLQAIEPDPEFCQEFRKKFRNQPLIEGTIEQVEAGTDWDGIVSINVLEHIQGDERELRHYHKMLRSRKGALNLFVPARQEIYAPIDKDFGHFRRYSKSELKTKLQQAGFEIVRLRYFNWMGYFAWWFNFCVLKRRRFDVTSVRFYDRLIFPMIYGMETRIMAPPFGQSLQAIARAV